MIPAAPRVVDTDVLVLGSGIGGLTYAIKAAALGEVTVLTKKEDSETNTNYAQGGIAAVMAPEDSFESHVRDTLRAGDGLCDPVAVRLLVRNGPAAVRELVALGIEFSHDPGAPERLDLGREGGHSARRIVHASDLTGREIERGLLAGAARAGVSIHEHLFALDLWVAPGSPPECLGALAVDRHSGELLAFRSRTTYLATGGFGTAYRFTTNPSIATGDGVAMAWRAGAPVANLEFVQFHPTALWPVEGRAFLISEAVRGEGATIRGVDGGPLMARLHPQGDLAPRDVVARAIDAEMRELGAGHVWLDCSSISADRFAERFPHILERCRARGYDPPAEPLPVVPAAHYACGGVRTDLGARTGVRRLLAVGEVACTGVHGANRLASNSLLEAVVFAERAARASAELLKEPDPPEAPVPRRNAGEPPPDPGEIARIRRRIGRILWEGAGIVRDDRGLNEARDRLEALSGGIPDAPREPAAAEMANLHLVARLIVRSARWREESRGLHFTRSHPEPDPAFRRNTLLFPPRSEEMRT
ncbi:MAG: L-aspartate oxidase [Gemmatimonadota bacterium]|nr:L-aspartate oxidase [Gemmatimonadota bacterium]